MQGDEREKDRGRRCGGKNFQARHKRIISRDREEGRGRWSCIEKCIRRMAWRSGGGEFHERERWKMKETVRAQ